LNREIHRIAPQPCVQFWHLMLHKVTARIGYITSDLSGLGSKSVSTKTMCDKGIVVRPNRSVLVGKRIIGWVVRRQRADPPSAPHVWSHQTFHDCAGTIRPHDSRPEAM